MIQPRNPSGSPASSRSFRQIASSSSLDGGRFRSNESATSRQRSRSVSRCCFEAGTIFKWAVFRRRDRRAGFAPDSLDSFCVVSISSSVFVVVAKLLPYGSYKNELASATEARDMNLKSEMPARSEVSILLVRAVGSLTQTGRPTQSRAGKNQRIHFFKVPEFRKIKSDRPRRVYRSALCRQY